MRWVSSNVIGLVETKHPGPSSLPLPSIARPGSPSGLLCPRSFGKHSTASRLCATQMAPPRPPHGPEPTAVCATLRSLQHLQGKAMGFVSLQKYLAFSNSQVREAIPARVHRQRLLAAGFLLDPVAHEQGGLLAKDQSPHSTQYSTFLSKYLESEKKMK